MASLDQEKLLKFIKDKDLLCEEKTRKYEKSKVLTIHYQEASIMWQYKFDEERKKVDNLVMINQEL